MALVLGIVAAGFTEPFQFKLFFQKSGSLPFFGGISFLAAARPGGTEFPFWTRRVWGGLPKWNALLPWPVRTGMAKEKKNESAGRRILIAACIAGALIGGVVGRNIPVKALLRSWRKVTVIGSAEGMTTRSSENCRKEIVENSLQIHCDGPETLVYVFEGNTVRMERFRNIVTSAFAAERWRSSSVGAHADISTAERTGNERVRKENEQKNVIWNGNRNLSMQCTL